MTFPQYPVYKNSGVKWLSDLPEHWDIRRNKQAFRIVSTLVGRKSKDFQLLSLTLRGVIPRDMESGKGKFPAEFDTYQTVEPGNIVFCLFDIDETPRTVGISSYSGMITGAYTVTKALAGADPRFVYYYYFSVDLRKGLRPFYTGLRKVVRPETFMNIELPLPSLSEQADICDFLDHETARIDTLVEEQQRLIELLKEKRRAVISHAVTKGLDSTVPMKDSGVEWLGDVPRHWDVLNFNLLVYIAEGQVNPRLRPYAEMVLIAPNHVESATGRLLYCETAEEQSADSGKYLCQKGDVVYSKIRPALRKVCLAPVACLCSADMYPMRGHSGLQNDYLYWFILSEPFSAFALLESERVAMPKINRESLGELKLTRPPANEQKQIAIYLSEKTRQLDTLIDEASAGVSLLLERRSALISAAVTGKIDLRGWHASPSLHSPELAEEAV